MLLLKKLDANARLIGIDIRRDVRQVRRQAQNARDADATSCRGDLERGIHLENASVVMLADAEFIRPLNRES